MVFESKEAASGVSNEAPDDLPSRKKIGSKRLVVNADDFGRSAGHNAAIYKAHHKGILSTASLMVNEPGFDEAVRMAKDSPRLGIGLHLTLVCGHSALSSGQIPGLANLQGEFSNSPAATGFRYFFNRSLREQLRREINAQFEKFHGTGLFIDHVNGHLHMHLHPTVFEVLVEEADRVGIRNMRLTRDPLSVDRELSSGNWAYRASHAVIYKALAARARPRLAARGIKHTDRVFGLLQNDRVNEPYLLALLDKIPLGTSEVYSHPSMTEGQHEFAALVSERVKQKVSRLGIDLIRYQDL
jgi:hopanoid biosynthesis associated protein HpnK